MIPYEFHLTVKCEPDRFAKFKDTCADLHVKPLLLDLHTKAGAQFQEMMTSSTIVSNDLGASNECDRIKRGLESVGFQVVRVKVESVPTHDAAPKENGDAMPAGCYFESHLGVRLFNEGEIEELAEWIEDAGHISRNVFKKHSDGSVTVMVTMRDYKGPYRQFAFAVDCVKKAIEVKWAVDKTIVEFITMDTQLEPDKEWLA